MSDDLNPDEVYLRPTAIIDSDHPEIIRFAQDAVGDAGDPSEKAKLLFYKVRDGIVYDTRSPFHLPEHYRASEVLRRGRGYCVPKACLLVAAGRAVGIPSRIGLADIRNHGASKQLLEMMGCNVFAFHGYAELKLHGRWVKATPAFDMPIYGQHNIAAVEFDGVHDAVFPSRNLKGEPYVEYLTTHGSFADLPLDALLAAWKKQYGEERVLLWIKAIASPEAFQNGSEL
ncbi:MAG: transglutaminase family protein [Thermodesulfobacteriota bacterium]